MQESTKKCARCYDYAASAHRKTKIRLHARRSTVFNQNALGATLFYVQSHLTFQNGLQTSLIRLFVTLHSRSLYTGTFSTVQHSKLNSRGIGVKSHGSAKCVNLSHDMTLC